MLAIIDERPWMQHGHLSQNYSNFTNLPVWNLLFLAEVPRPAGQLSGHA